MISPCILIPVYNHGNALAATLGRLAPFRLPVLIVNDGSDSATCRILEQLADSNESVTLLNLSRNSGKGAAVMAGFRMASEMGHSHAIQIDADGQHDVSDLTTMLKLLAARPDAVICGQPVFDDSVPRVRYFARYITHFWVWVETLSFAIKDSMCGFRAYPLEPCLRIINGYSLGTRMDFDTEILVRLFWEGVEPCFFPTRVIYPDNGLSHFRPLEDNLRISWMHTRMVMGMLRRLPALLFRPASRHWSETRDRGGVAGILLLFHLYKWFGRKPFSAILRVVIFYYTATSSRTRRVSRQYWDHMLAENPNIDPSRARTGFWQTYRHLFSFGETMLDKLAVWSGDINMDDLDVEGDAQLIAALAKGKGAILLTSHFGNTEICLAMSKKIPAIRNVNALVFNIHAPRFGQALKRINREATLNLVHIDQVGMDTAIRLQEMVDRNELIAIAADRTPVGTRHRTQAVKFLGDYAEFPEGPWILAHTLRCPVFMLSCARDGERFKVEIRPLAELVNLPRASRTEDIRLHIQQFAALLEKWVIRYPYQWYNFYDFWRRPDSSAQQTNER
jgi:predicted LPLAT superfamily acyltransferase/GT2 family glycosyltransferase